MGKGILVAASVLGVLSIVLIVASLLSSRRKPARRPTLSGSHPALGYPSHTGSHPSVAGYAPTPSGGHSMHSGSYAAPMPMPMPMQPPAMQTYAPPTAMPSAAPWVEPDPATEFMSVEDMLRATSHDQGPAPQDATQIIDDAVLIGGEAHHNDDHHVDDDHVEPTMLLSEDMLGLDLDPPTEPARLKPRLPAAPVQAASVHAAPQAALPPRPAPAPTRPAPTPQAPAQARPPAASPVRSSALPTPTRPSTASGSTGSTSASPGYQVAPPLARGGSPVTTTPPRMPAPSPTSAASRAAQPVRSAGGDAYSPPDAEGFAKPRSREFSTPYVGEATPSPDALDDDDDEPGTELVHQAELLRLMGKSSS